MAYSRVYLYYLVDVYLASQLSQQFFLDLV